MMRDLPVMVCASLLSACSGYHSEANADGYDIEVVASEVRKVDGLGRHPSGALLATEEYRGGGLLRIDPVSGASTYLLRDLADPDNIVVLDGDVYVTEEDAQGRIVRIDSLNRRSVFADGLDGPEGLDVGPDGKLYVAEHAPSGRVYRYSLQGERETVGSAKNGEGLRVLPDGTVLVAETSEGRVVAFDESGNKSTFADGFHSPDGVAYDPGAERVLVTEDEAPGRLLSVDLDSRVVDVVATGLNAPQTMLLESDGSILLAEQGEDRILRLRPQLEEP
jgi:DNA-binding beta-propeller fold protein YncE